MISSKISKNFNSRKTYRYVHHSKELFKLHLTCDFDQEIYQYEGVMIIFNSHTLSITLKQKIVIFDTFIVLNCFKIHFLQSLLDIEYNIKTKLDEIQRNSLNLRNTWYKYNSCVIMLSQIDKHKFPGKSATRILIDVFVAFFLI